MLHLRLIHTYIHPRDRQFDGNLPWNRSDSLEGSLRPTFLATIYSTAKDGKGEPRLCCWHLRRFGGTGSNGHHGWVNIVQDVAVILLKCFPWNILFLPA